jgi:hypothetical protein
MPSSYKDTVYFNIIHLPSSLSLHPAPQNSPTTTMMIFASEATSVNSVNFFINVLLGYIHCTWGFIVTNPIRIVLYIIYILPVISPPHPSSPHFKQLQGSLVLFHIGIWSPSIIYPHLKLLLSLPLPLVHPFSCTHCAYFITLVFVINI